MGQTLARILLHVVFSTKGREPTIERDWEPRLFAYMGTVADSEGATLIAGGGSHDHVHLLLACKPTVAPADLVRSIKANSSRWVKESLAGGEGFAWQIGYAAFSVSESAVTDVVGYIAGQRERHAKVTFQDELRAFALRHCVVLDERHAWV